MTARPVHSLNPRLGERLWLVNLFFGSRDGPPTGLFLESLAVELELSGHQIEVLTGNVAYNGDLVDGTRRFRGQVTTLYSGPLNAEHFTGKLLTWFCFYVSLFWHIITHRMPDKVVVMTTPPFLHVLFSMRNFFSSKPTELILWNQDTYPEVLVAVGLIRPDGWIFRLLSKVERWSMKRIDKVIALDQAMAQLDTVLRGARDTRSIPIGICLIPEEQQRVDLPAPLLERMQKYRYLIIYTRNFGWGHDLSVLQEWWELHPDQRDFFFLFIGGGCKSERLREWQQLQREFLDVRPYVSRAEFWC